MWWAEKDVEDLESTGPNEVHEDFDGGEYGGRITWSDRNDPERHPFYAFTVLGGWLCFKEHNQDSRLRFGTLSKREKHYRGLGVVKDGFTGVRMD